MPDRATFIAKQIRFTARDWHTVSEIMEQGDFTFTDLVKESVFLARQIQEAQACGLTALLAQDPEGNTQRSIPTKIFIKPTAPKQQNGGSRNEFPVEIQGVIDREVAKRIKDVEDTAMEKAKAKIELEVRRALKEEHDTIKKAESIRKKMKGQPTTRIIGVTYADSVKKVPGAGDPGNE